MSEQLSPKEILKRQKHQHDFTVYQIAFLKHLEDTVDYGNKTFTNFSVDPTQIPCLLMMNIVSHFKRELNEEDYNSFKDFTHDLLEGIFPKIKPMLKVVKNETHK